MAASCQKTIIIMALEKRRFVKKLDFLTSVGFGDGSATFRERSGVAGSGPFRVITHEALFGFDEQSRRMVLLEVAPGKSAQQIQEKVDFKLNLAPDLEMMPEPTESDLRLLREVCDPEGYFLKRIVK